MNYFKIILENIILISFPILIYLVYLFTNKNIKSKDLYFKISLITSLYLVKCFGSNIFVSILVLNSVVILLYINDYYIFSNMVGGLIILLFLDSFNNTAFLSIIYLLFLLLYIIKRKLKISNLLFIACLLLLSITVNNYWVYKYNAVAYQKIIGIDACYIGIALLLYLIYEEGNRILEIHLDYKELKREEQVHLSLFKIAHEIKNPIAVCKCYLDMMNTNDQKQVERFIPIIKSEIQRILVLLEDFLNINRPTNNFDMMDINMLVEDVVDKLNPVLEENKIQINTKLIDDEIYINGDYNRLNQMLLNIVKNSIESIDNEGKINIESEIRNKEYILTIEDNGIGMSKEILSKMNEPFFTTKSRGTGLGMSLIHEIASNHRIKINYKSKENIGTKVTLRFKCI